MANGVLPNLLPFSDLGESYVLNCSFAEGLDARQRWPETSEHQFAVQNRSHPRSKANPSAMVLTPSAAAQPRCRLT
jgi:hypothetical protein